MYDLQWNKQNKKGISNNKNVSVANYSNNGRH